MSLVWRDCFLPREPLNKKFRREGAETQRFFLLILLHFSLRLRVFAANNHTSSEFP